MSDLILFDFADLSFDRFSKVQHLLKPGNTIPANTHIKSNVNDRYALAKKIINATLTLLDSSKNKQETQISNKRHIFELASLAFGVLYEAPVTANTDYKVEKRHISFTLKLVDIGMLDQAFIELDNLAISLFNHLLDFKKLEFLEYSAASLLSLPIPNIGPSEATINIVLLSQIALFKALSKILKMQPRPVANSTVLGAFESSAGPLAWCALLTQPNRDQKLTLISKLLFALSNNSSIQTSFKYRLLALRLIPVIEQNYINLTLGTFESLRKISKMSIQEIVQNFGFQILLLSSGRLSQLRKSDNYVLFFEMCYNAAKQVSLLYQFVII